MNNPMSPRAVYMCASAVLGLAFVIYLIASPAGLEQFGLLWLIGGPVFGLAGWLIQILFSCPGCGNPMTRRRLEGLPWKAHWYAPWPPKRCDECGARLDVA